MSKILFLTRESQNHAISVECVTKTIIIVSSIYTNITSVRNVSVYTEGILHGGAKI